MRHDSQLHLQLKNIEELFFSSNLSFRGKKNEIFNFNNDSQFKLNSFFFWQNARVSAVDDNLGVVAAGQESIL